MSAIVIESKLPQRCNRSTPRRGNLQNSHRHSSHSVQPSHANDGWGSPPSSRLPDVIRIGFQNIQGIPRNPFAPKHVQIRSMIEYYRCDFFGVAEINLHLRFLKSFEQWKERFRRMPRNHSIHACNQHFPHTRNPILFGRGLTGQVLQRLFGELDTAPCFCCRRDTGISSGGGSLKGTCKGMNIRVVSKINRRGTGIAWKRIR